MFRSRIRTLLSVLTVLVLAVAAFAQSGDNATLTASGDAAQPQQPSVPPAALEARRARHTTCWKEAGVAPDKINEQWKIRDAGKVRISGVCTDPKLSAAQRQEKIHTINDETDKEIARLIPAKQLSVYRTCEAKREAEAKPRRNQPKEKELGPCGGTIPASSKDAAHSHEHTMMSNQ